MLTARSSVPKARTLRSVDVSEWACEASERAATRTGTAMSDFFLFLAVVTIGALAAAAVLLAGSVLAGTLPAFFLPRAYSC